MPICKDICKYNVIYIYKKAPFNKKNAACFIKNPPFRVLFIIGFPSV